MTLSTTNLGSNCLRFKEKHRILGRKYRLLYNSALLFSILSLSYACYRIGFLNFSSPDQNFYSNNSTTRETDFKLTSSAINSEKLSTKNVNNGTVYERVRNASRSLDNENFQAMASISDAWNSNRKSFCKQQLAVYAGRFALLKNVTVNRALAVSKHRGGEDLMQSIGQPEGEEYFRLQSSFIELQCPTQDIPNTATLALRKQDSPLSEILASLQPSKAATSSATITIDTRPTILVQRREFLNIFHTVTDWYNAFLMIEFFKLDQDNVQVLFFDAKPRGIFDETWAKLFNKYLRLSDLPQPTHFDSLVLSIWGYESQMFTFENADLGLPLSERFREFVLKKHGLEHEASRALKCDHLTVTFVQRRPYSNRRGLPTQRLVANEEELLGELSSRSSKLEARKPGLKIEVRTVRFELMNFTDQLRAISRTDVLLGMHGAGMTHTYFVPKHAAVIELMERKLMWDIQEFFFRHAAAWRNLHYSTWRNREASLELSGNRLYVLTNVVGDLLERAIQRMCNI